MKLLTIFLLLKDFKDVITAGNCRQQNLNCQNFEVFDNNISKLILYLNFFDN